jgi:hypothetical protein
MGDMPSTVTLGLDETGGFAVAFGG